MVMTAQLCHAPPNYAVPAAPLPLMHPLHTCCCGPMATRGPLLMQMQTATGGVCIKVDATTSAEVFGHGSLCTSSTPGLVFSTTAALSCECWHGAACSSMIPPCLCSMIHTYSQVTTQGHDLRIAGQPAVCAFMSRNQLPSCRPMMIMQCICARARSETHRFADAQGAPECWTMTWFK